MAADSNAASRWGRALAELAVEAHAEDAVLRDLDEVLEAVRSEDDTLLRVLASPVFDTEERKRVLDVVLGRIGVQPLTTHFLKLLVDRGRVGALPEIVRFYRETMDERAGRLRVQVRTVEPLSPELERELVAAFERSTGKQVVLEASLDPSLLGGMVARIGGRVFDASLRTRLYDLKHRLIHAHALPEA